MPYRCYCKWCKDERKDERKRKDREDAKQERVDLFEEELS